MSVRPSHIRLVRRPRLRSGLAIPLLVAFLAMTAFAPAASARSGYVKGLFFAGVYEAQIDNRTCVPASVAMMMNVLSHGDVNLNQMTVLRYAQRRDALVNSVQRGTDPLGWAKAATFFSTYTARPTTYVWEAYSTEQAALRRAAVQLARYGKSVGLLVRHGAHAVVMDGFAASRNPLTGGPWQLYGVSYSDPLGPVHAYASAASSPLDSYLQLDATAEFDRLWYGKYIVIVPVG
jgi:hypothetical protein